MYNFTRRKFLALSLQKQHKKCAELLHCLYHKQIQDEEWKTEWLLYQEFNEWMNVSVQITPTLQNIADGYHAHLQEAQIFKKEHHFLPPIRKGDRPQGEERWPIAIYLDHLRSAHNVGSILRTIEAFSLGTLYFSSQTPFITQRQVQNTAKGTVQWVPCHQNTALSTLPKPCIVLETSPKSVPLHEMIFPYSFTLVVGNEEYGCSDEILKQADFLVEIPMRGRKNSLNVANAFAIAAAEILRQRNLHEKNFRASGYD